MTIFNRFFAIIACIATLGLTSVSCTGDTPDGPDTEQPVNQQPGNDQPGNEQPGNEQPGNDQPGNDQPGDTPNTPPETESWYSVNYWDRSDREKAGFHGAVKKWHVSTYSSYDEMEYDELGHLLYIRHFSDGQPGDVTAHKYNDKGQRISTIVTNAGGDYTYSEITYEYGNDGKYVPLSSYIYHSRLEGCNEDIMPGLKASHEKSNNSPQYDGIIDTSYDFDEDGNLTITRHSYLADKWNDNAIFEGSEVKEEYKWTFTGAYPYSSSGGITAMTWQDNGMPESWDSSVPETTYTWEGPYRVNHCEWLKSNVTLGIKNYKHVAGYVGGYLDDYWRTNEYDSYDALIHSSFCITNDDKAIDYYYSDYVYDSHGNWTSRKEDIMGVLDGNRSVSVLTREIEYF